MRKKRERHDRVVEKYKSKEPCEENVSLFQKNMYTVQNEFFKNENTKRENLNQNFDQYDENGEENGLDHDNDEDNDFEDPDARCKNIYLPKCVASWVRGPKIEHQFMPTLEYRRIPECWELFLSKELCLIAKELLVVAVS